MNKKTMKLLLGAICVLSSIMVGCSLNDNESETQENDMNLIEQIFEISESKYEIIEVENELSADEYGGSYSVLLKVNKADMPAFIEEIEEHYYAPEDIEAYSIPIKNVYGKELGKKDLFYTRVASVRRTIEGWWVAKPKSCGFYIICSEAVDGVYEVKMKYTE